MGDVGNTRRLVAILAADVAEYSRLMHEDEEGTIAAWQSARRDIIDPVIAEHGGRIVKHTGDGFLAEFATVTPAVRCAVQLQSALGDCSLIFRMGINLGEIVADADDIHGDGVNIAARLEGLAEPGGICISGAVYDQVHYKIDLGYDDLGEQKVKNIASPVRVYRILPSVGSGATSRPLKKWDTGRWRTPAIAVAAVVLLAGAGIAWWQPWVTRVEAASIERMAFPLPEQPSIAVLPFTNFSGDKDQEFFADGITEDIFTDLSKVPGLFVVARNSTFTYKGKTVKFRQVAEDLGVRYVLKGSVRRSNERIRINVQLIDAVKGSHQWAERYDRKLTDVFAVQNDVTRTVVSELAVAVKASEQERLFRSHTTNLEAYETFLRGRRLLGVSNDTEIWTKRKELFERVIELDPKFAGGYAGLSFTYIRQIRYERSRKPEALIQRALSLAEKAIKVDDTFGWSYVALANAYLEMRERDKAVDTMREAVRIHPSDADAHKYLGFFLHWTGNGEDAIAALKTYKRLDPRFLGGRGSVLYLGQAQFVAGRYEEAIDILSPYFAHWARVGNNALAYLAASYSAMGREEQARAAMKAFLKIRPKTRLAS